MTAIVYYKGVLAADSRATDADGFVLKSSKLYTLSNGAILGGAGDSDIRDILTILSKASPKKMPTKASLAKTETEFVGIIVFPEGQVFRININQDEDTKKWFGEVLEILDEFAVAGSGGSYAAGAILAGKSAIDAVKIACKLDSGCSLPVEHIKIG